MISQKSHTKPHGGVNRELKILVLFLDLISFSNLIFSNNTFALFTPSLSASVDQANLQINGNQVINSTNKTTEIPLNLTVNTNNKTGYTATLNAETNETALVNNDSTANAKINSISSAGPLGSFSNNTWGYKFGTSSNYEPIPALSSPTQILQTTGKTNGNETNSIKIGMKLTENLESGNYTNKLILSFVSNPYRMRAVMTEGPDFNTKLKALETATNKIEHFKKGTVAPAASMNAINIEDEESECEIKLWLDPTDKTAYYYAESQKVYLNADSSKMFYDMRSLTSLNLSNFDTSKVTNMAAMFNDTPFLTTLDLSSFNTSKVINMSKMFYHMPRLTSLNLSNFDTSQVTNMAAMFTDIPFLTTLDLSSFNTSKVTNMSSMFSGMQYLTSLNLSSFDTSNVTDMSYMFLYVYNLISLNLSSFNTSKVTNMSHMFTGMTNLTTIDLSNFDTSQVTDMDFMFALRNQQEKPEDKLGTIYVNNDFNTAKLIYFAGMFQNRKKLRGGNGSYLADPDSADKSWLRVDRPGVKGYFTRKS